MGPEIEVAADEFGALVDSDVGKLWAAPTCSSISMTSAPRNLKRTSNPGENRLGVWSRDVEDSV
jgi:hypothetical protein